MSTVTKCDICGEIYGINRPTKVSSIDLLDYHADDDCDYEKIDCCPECTKKLIGFIEVLKSGYDYTIHVKHPIPKEDSK